MEDPAYLDGYKHVLAAETDWDGRYSYGRRQRTAGTTGKNDEMDDACFSDVYILSSSCGSCIVLAEFQYIHELAANADKEEGACPFPGY